ncbi:RNA dependent RNA polymerase-domain-containing protein [Chaetomium tenue]|uniref:RNA dependent RNA polymerase-domain-containing protein n=1 Tax=Chaetomium tenue TaxID=1854479 RepID=A0ACB7PDQ9_9PEZI|nr:RNA dependent RNA polymerase-domain-containing protein [Chaetomium globosum]
MGKTPGPAIPSTPTNKRIVGNVAVEKVIRQLNSDYNLDIEIPDPTLSPVKRKELGVRDEKYARSDHICRGIQFLFYQKGDTLDQALGSFFNEAKAASLRWAPKSHAEPGTLPSPRTPPTALSGPERWKLQSILIDVIDHFKARARPAVFRPESNGDTRHGSVLASGEEGPESPGSPGSKRSFDSDDDHGAKRTRGQALASFRGPGPSPTPSAFTDALDKVPTRRHLGHASPKNWTPERRRPDEERDSSSDTSNSSKVSSVFSSRGRQQSTQTTVGRNSQEPKRPLGTPISTRPSPSQFSAANRITPHAPRSRGPTDSPPKPSPRSSAVSTVYSESSVPSTSSPDTAPGPSSSWDRGDDGLDSNEPTPIQGRLQNIWPKFPRWLRDAPLPVAWEITRICLHCKVEIDNDTVKYDPKWAKSDMLGIWRSLSQLEPFRGKSFPERPPAEVFAAALAGFESRGNTVVMSAALEFNPNKSGPLFLLDMKPLRFDEGCRLTRRFGPDRFLEVLIPSPTALNAPPIIKDTAGGADQLIQWFTQKPHSIVGRQWQAFYSKDAGYRKPPKDFKLGPDAKATFKERVHFFAENGPNFRPTSIRSRHEIPSDTAQQRAQIRVSQMLDWLLHLDQNEGQPHLKLFSRIQLGLSKTFPAVKFEPEQILHRPEDILSPTGKVMNDGIGRMSRSVARKVRDALGLSDIPSAIQGRMGSAKGMWLMDVGDSGDTDWIETYPSQRKWNCDDTDPYHRTLEVRSVASELKPAGLNLQFLPVLEDRARDKRRMKRAIGNRLTNDLELQFENQKTALKRPSQFRQWVNENSNDRGSRVKHGQVPFLGGLPESKSEILNFLLNSGFDPKSQKYLQDLAWELQKQKCDILRTKLNIRVGRSAYIYMVIDFWGVLEENEVHVGFSSKFRDESDDISYTLLADCDVLVARSPAHFVSDVQKVRAVFKPELHALKDVIVFSAKGNIPLADKLSGGDYDGDMAWVCWDPDIVENFVNADMPDEPDLSAYLGKDKTTFEELVLRTGQTGNRARYEAVYDMINKSFQFAMQPNYLGICTNYKERVCYHNNSVSNSAAVFLSSLVGKLVDQSKQGIIFNAESWDRLRRDCFYGRMFYDDPAYKGDHWGGTEEPQHIIDYLKFSIAKPAIDRELQSFHESMAAAKGSAAEAAGEGAHFWDPDLAMYYEHIKTLTQTSRSLKSVLEGLNNAICGVEREWKRLIHLRDGSLGYPEKVKRVYAKWLEIDLASVTSTGSNTLDSKTVGLLGQPYLAERGASATSMWELIKASAAFKMYYQMNPKFVWQIAGCQLAFMKAQVISGRAGGGSDGMALLVTPHMYAGLTPDGRFVKQYVARLEGDGSEYPVVDDDEETGGGGGRGDDVD